MYSITFCKTDKVNMCMSAFLGQLNYKNVYFLLLFVCIISKYITFIFIVINNIPIIPSVIREERYRTISHLYTIYFSNNNVTNQEGHIFSDLLIAVDAKLCYKKSIQLKGT